MNTKNILKRPIFGIFPENNKLKIGQLFDLRDESFLESSVLKTEESPAIRIFDEKNVVIEIFHRPICAEFFSNLSENNLLTQLKAHANLGIFKPLTSDNRILSPNSDALISIKFIFRKKVLKLSEIDANFLELNENFIAKSQFAVTEIELGQWILVSVSSKNGDEKNSINFELEVIQKFLENYFFENSENSEIPFETSNFFYKFITSESVFDHQNPVEYITFKEFFENLKFLWNKCHRYFPISVKLTSLLDLGFFTIDNRLETLQYCRSSRNLNFYEFFLKFFCETETAIFELQKALTSHLKIFTIIILKRLRQSEIYFCGILEKFKKISIYNKPKLEFLKIEIENSRFLASIETFLKNLESQFAIKQSNFIEFETQKLLNFSLKNVKFVLIIGENEKQKIDFINFLINICQCSTLEEALTYKITTFIPYSNVSPRKAIILTKNEETTIFVIIKGMDYCSNNNSQKFGSEEFGKIFRGEKKLNSVILLFSKSRPLRFFEKWIPKQLLKATNNFIYLNFYNRQPLNSKKWMALAEILPSGPLYFLHQKVLKQNFIQMSKADLQNGIQDIQQILRKIFQSSQFTDGMEEEDTVVGYVKEILDISKDLMEQQKFFTGNKNDNINSTDKMEIKNFEQIFVENLANLCKFENDQNLMNFFANTFLFSSKYSIIWDTVMRMDSLSQKEIKNICDEIINFPNIGQFYHQRLAERLKTDIITYNCETKISINFFNEKFAFSWNNERVFEKY